MSKTKTVTTLRVREYDLECPHCGEVEYGFIGGYRGETLTCEKCDKDYTIHEDADFEMY